MSSKHIGKSDLTGKVVDVHAHVGINIKAFCGVRIPLL